MSTTRILGVAFAGLAAFAALYLLGAWLRLYGSLESAGAPTATRVSTEVVAARQRSQQLRRGGSLHVHGSVLRRLPHARLGQLRRAE